MNDDFNADSYANNLIESMQKTTHCHRGTGYFYHEAHAKDREVQQLRNAIPLLVTKLSHLYPNKKIIANQSGAMDNNLKVMFTIAPKFS